MKTNNSKLKYGRSYDLLSAFDGYAPQWGGLFILAAFLVLGAILASGIEMALYKFFSPQVIGPYIILVVYPVQFIPAMIYASIKSRRALGFDDNGTPIDNGHFAPIGGIWLSIMAVVGTLACAVITEQAVNLLPEMPDRLKAAMEMLTGGPLWVSLLSTAVMAPFFEEWLCRGMVLRGMLQKHSPATAIMVSAAFFAIIHMNPWQAIPAFIIGCLFGLVYWKTGSLKLTMLMHCANNAFAVLMTQLPGAEGKDYLYQFFDSQWQYWLVYATCFALVILLVVRLLKTKFTE